MYKYEFADIKPEAPGLRMEKLDHPRTIVKQTENKPNGF